MDDLYLNLPNFVELSDPLYWLGSLSLTVAYGACFAFIIYFALTSLQLAPRYKLVAILSAVVMASAGLSLLKEAQLWQSAFDWNAATGTWQPDAGRADGDTTFTNAFRYGNWTITVPLLLTQLPIALGLARREIHPRSIRMSVAGVLMIWTGLVGQFGEVSDLGLFNLWGIVSTLFFVWLLVEVLAVLRLGKAAAPQPLKDWSHNLLFYMLFTWGLYPIAYALPQVFQSGEAVVAQQLIFTLADITTKLIYGVILSRYCLRRSALEGYGPAIAALDDTGTAQGPVVVEERV